RLRLVHTRVDKPVNLYLLRVYNVFSHREHSEENEISQDSGVDETSSRTSADPDPPDAKTSGREPITPSESIAVSSSEVPDLETETVISLDSVSSDESTATLDSPKVLRRPKTNDKTSSTDQVTGLQRESHNLQIISSSPKRPRAATIRVSRKKQTISGQCQKVDRTPSECVVHQSSWLDVWKGRKHNVLWSRLDGHLMSMWKKRSDKFTEFVFHVSSITNIRKLDQGRFSVHLQKKHFEFMAHSEAVQKGWLESLYASRGGEPMAASKRHGSLYLKDRRKKMYTAICGYSLWIYRSKEDFNLGLGITCVSMNIASVKSTGRYSFSLITPYKTFNFSADSAKDSSLWLDSLNEVIRNALSYSEVALRLWASPCNKVCADCGAANPEWASVNLLLVVCEACAGVHRSLGTDRSKVRSLKLDDKIWTEPLIQIGPDYSPEQRSEFIIAKYQRGLYRKAHPLAASQRLLDQRLLEVASGPNVDETLSLLCSGARVCSTGSDRELASAVSVAEASGQTLQAEILKLNKSMDAPVFEQMHRSEETMEELHGKLDEERFLFSQENESAACDVLDLTEVISVFDCSAGEKHVFEIVLAGAVSDTDLQGVCGVSRVSIREGNALQCVEVWCSIKDAEMNIHTPQRQTLTLDAHTRCHLQSVQNGVLLEFPERTLHMQFELEHSCVRWYELIERMLCDATDGRSGSVSPPVERCISHITLYGLRVDGLYRRCGVSPHISKLVDALRVSPKETVLETDELSVLDVSGALKQILRESEIIPQTQTRHWLQAAALPSEDTRLQTYSNLLKLLPGDNQATLAALCAHLHSVQKLSGVNRMTAHNLAVIFVVTLFKELAMNSSLVQLTKELIVHHTCVFTSHVERDGVISTAL
ncbi:hypothetical protein DNTS_015119, partial [Danionella cerebrum]